MLLKMLPETACVLALRFAAHWQSGHGDRCGEDEENSCPVCLEDMEYRFELPCNHMICEVPYLTVL